VNSAPHNLSATDILNSESASMSLSHLASRSSVSAVALQTPIWTYHSLSRELNNSSLFSYTSGRYLFNEELRLKERYIEFNVEALKTAASASLAHQHGSVTNISKLGEGGFNRVFTLTMEDGFEVIAKIPYHIAVPEYFATASEAATLAFLRSKGVPVPKVYSYCACAENPVGAEYLLMEKADGVSLKSKWLELTEEEISKLAHSFVEAELKLAEIPFSATGSLYFKKDIASELQAPLYKEGHVEEQRNSVFCISLITSYMFWYGRRAGLNLNRGPWAKPAEYLQSVAQKEIEWTKRYGKPMELDFPFNAMDLEIQGPEEYIKLLERFQALTPHLLSKDPKHSFNQPVLRHPDPTPANIYISPNTGRITCLIDWQHTILQPRLLAASYPSTFANPDSSMDPTITFPQLPADLATRPLADQVAAREVHRRRVLFHTYRVFNQHLNKPHLHALNDPLQFDRQILVDAASWQWCGNLVTLKSRLIRAVTYFEHLPDVAGIACPVSFSPVELDGSADTEDTWIKASMWVEVWCARVPRMEEEGWVENGEYEEAKRQLKELVEGIWEECEEEVERECFLKGWPFRDREEVS
jgi:aminoglycoside phosphotransferase (APT) family kinase protein